MHFRARLHRFFALLAILALFVASSPAPLLAQEGAVYFPVVAGGTPDARTASLLRTRIQIATPADWRTVGELGVVNLAGGEDWALVLADDAQLADLARWGFAPDGTDALAALVQANPGLLAASGADFTALLKADTRLAAQVQGGVQAAGALRIDLRRQMQTVTEAEMAFLVDAVSADADNDGLNDTLEVYWCTDSAMADSDGDGTTDGAEVAALKAWLLHQRAASPDSGRPAADWPPNLTGCYDTDKDSVPDRAETFELGLNPGRESTDRDKFDDGQELFGTTHCPGSGTGCGWGSLPRNDDWGVIFAEMPSWVRAPGNHPLVAAFPVPKIDVVESSFKVIAATTVTTDKTISLGTEANYSTAETKGSSSSLANTITWNNWQETSESVQTRQIVAAAQPPNPVPVPTPAPPPNLSKNVGATEVAELMGVPVDCIELEGSAGLDVWVLSGDVTVKVNGEYADHRCRNAMKAAGILDNDGSNSDLPGAYQAGVGTGGYEGYHYSYDPSGQVIADRLYEIGNILSAPVRTQTNTQGSSKGGSQTVTHAQYEEHTVTNGEAFSTAESWGTATAVNSIHAADLKFTYRVANAGTEYAREIGNLAFNVYIGDDPNPAATYFVANDLGGDGTFKNFMPNEAPKQFTIQQPIALTLAQMRAIDLGGPIRIVVEDFSYGIDELFYEDAAKSGVLLAIEDGTDDGDEAINAYLAPTWGSETVLQVLKRAFPYQTDADGTVIAIWTPEYRSDTPAWCRAPRRPTDFPSKEVWCKHDLSTADWWNVYTDGLGDGSEGFQATPAAPGATALFRFNKDSDLDGYSDRSEARLGTDPYDASSLPRPELLAGLHRIRSGQNVVATLSLLNTGQYDAYGVEAVMVAPDDSVSILNNTVGGSGRVRTGQQVIVGSSVRLQSPLPPPWVQQGHAVPAAGGYYTGPVDRTYTFTVQCGATGGCDVGSGTWALAWNDGAGVGGSLNFGAGYKSPTFLSVGALGVTLALYSGKVTNSESFTLAAHTPRDTFQFQINREPFTEPLVIVSYNDPQGNHRFMLPPDAMALSAPTANLNAFSGRMLDGAGVELVTSAAYTGGAGSVRLLVNNPSGTTLQNAKLFLEFVNISGTVVSEIPTQVTLPPGPIYTTVNFNNTAFNPAWRATDDYIAIAFLTDHEGNILDTAGRPLSSWQADPLPNVEVDAAALTWNFGTVAQGALLKRSLALANTGFGALYTYLQPGNGLSLDRASRIVGGADMSDYALTMRTAGLPVGPYDRTVPIFTSDLDRPTLNLRVMGTVTAPTGDTAGGASRPLDVPVTVQGPRSQGDWVDFTHTLGPDPATLHPVKLLDGATLKGLGRYAMEFQSTTSSSFGLFGDGSDGKLTVETGQVVAHSAQHSHITAFVAAGSSFLPLHHTSGYIVGDEVLVIQMQGGIVGTNETRYITSVSSEGVLLDRPLSRDYHGMSGACGGGFLTSYYNNPTLSGTPVLERCEGSANLLADFEAPAPGLSVDNFSVRWVGRRYIPQTGTYQLGAAADDGIRMFVDGSLVFNEWHSASATYGFAVTLSAGWHDFIVDYFEYGNHAFATIDMPGEIYSAQAVVVPHYSTVSIASGAILAADPWDGRSGGVLAFRAMNAVDLLGTVTVAGAGFRGAWPNLYGEPAGSYSGEGSIGGHNYARNSCWGRWNANGNGGGSGHYWIPNIYQVDRWASGGGGGGNASGGGQGTCQSAPDRCLCAGGGGSAIDTANNQALIFGGGGGAGGAGKYGTENGQAGGNGGGIIYVSGRMLSIGGSAQANGAVGGNAVGSGEQTGGSGGGGAGGSIFLSGSDVVVAGQVSAIGASGGTGNGGGSAGGAGGVGRIRIRYCSSVIGSTSPTATVEKLDCFIVEQIESAPFNSGRLNLPSTVAYGASAGYAVQYGRRLVMAANTPLVTTLRLPSGLLASATLNALVSGLPATAAFSLDIGNDGSAEWAANISNNSTTASSDLAAAFNAYWQSHGAPTTGTLDVPIKVTLSQPGQVLLTNLQVSTAGAKTRSIRLNAGTYSAVNLQFQVGGSGSGPLSVALDLGANGSLDWSWSQTANRPINLTTGNLATAINAYLAGKSGEVDVPLRFFVAPDAAVTMVDFTATAAPALDMTASSLRLNGVTAAGVTAGIREGANVPLAVTLNNPGGKASGPVAVAFFATAAGWGDWYIGSSFIPNMTAGGSATAQIEWNTLGFAGNVPVKAIINPYGRTGETSYANNTASLIVAITPLATPPVAAFTSDKTSGVTPLTVQFTDQSTGEITSRTWTFGDGQSSATQTPSYTYRFAGVFTVKLTVSGPGGSSSATHTITVTGAPPPKPAITISANKTSGIAPLTMQFTATTSGGPVSGWAWDFKDGGASTLQNPAHTFQSPGVFDVILTATGPGGVEAKTLRITVTGAPPPKPAITISANKTSGAAPLTVQFTATTSGGPVSTWAWDFKDGGASTVQNPAHTFQSPGVFDVTLTASGPGGVEAQTLRITVTNAPPPKPAITISVNKTAGAAPLTVQFTATTSGGPVSAWAWDFKDDGASTLQNPAHTFQSPGVFDVTLTASGPGGVEAKTRRITVTNAPPPKPAITISANKTSGIAPLTVQFTATVSGGPVSAWAWDFKDGSASLLQNPVYTFPNPGSFDVTFTASGPGGEEKKTLLITVANAPPPAGVLPKAYLPMIRQ